VVKALRLCADDQEKEINATLNDHILAPDSLVPGSSPAASNLPSSDAGELHRAADAITSWSICRMTSSSRQTGQHGEFLEVRAPFTDDWELFDVAWRMPFHLKYKEWRGRLS
jgi:hypothetical protein